MDTDGPMYCSVSAMMIVCKDMYYGTYVLKKANQDVAQQYFIFFTFTVVVLLFSLGRRRQKKTLYKA